MKRKIIDVESVKHGAQVRIVNGSQAQKPRRFPSLDEALDFVLPLGNRHTRLRLNGYPCVLHGWVK